MFFTFLAGDCWAARSYSFNTCKTLLKKNVTKEQCCKYSGEGISWTEESYSYSDIFKLTNLQNGVPNCQACRGESGHGKLDQIEQVCKPKKMKKKHISLIIFYYYFGTFYMIPLGWYVAAVTHPDGIILKTCLTFV